MFPTPGGCVAAAAITKLAARAVSRAARSPPPPPHSIDFPLRSGSHLARELLLTFFLSITHRCSLSHFLWLRAPFAASCSWQRRWLCAAFGSILVARVDSSGGTTGHARCFINTCVCVNFALLARRAATQQSGHTQEPRLAPLAIFLLRLTADLLRSEKIMTP